MSRSLFGKLLKDVLVGEFLLTKKQDTEAIRNEQK